MRLGIGFVCGVALTAGFVMSLDPDKIKSWSCPIPAAYRWTAVYWSAAVLWYAAAAAFIRKEPISDEAFGFRVAFWVLSPVLVPGILVLICLRRLLVPKELRR